MISNAISYGYQEITTVQHNLEIYHNVTDITWS
jgi:hypothetical protein